MPKISGKEYPLLLEESLWIRGYTRVAGMDEVGRGSLAGPVFACAVVFTPFYFDERVKDSKKLSPARRNKLMTRLQENCTDMSFGLASAREIDRLNILEATHLAMQRAVHGLREKPHAVLVDGNTTPGSGIEELAVIDGDEKSFTISAASVLAKVARDKFMTQLAGIFPDFRFEKNKGYGTMEHIAQIKKQGPCRQHRLSFLAGILNDTFCGTDL